MALLGKCVGKTPTVGRSCAMNTSEVDRVSFKKVLIQKVKKSDVSVRIVPDVVLPPVRFASTSKGDFDLIP